MTNWKNNKCRDSAENYGFFAPATPLSCALKNSFYTLTKNLLWKQENYYIMYFSKNFVFTTMWSSHNLKTTPNELLCKQNQMFFGLNLLASHSARTYLQPHYGLWQWGFWQCLPFSWKTLRGKHCRHPIAIMGVV